MHFAWRSHSGEVLLGESFILATLLDDLAHLQGDPVVVQLFRLAIQFGRVLADQMLFVLPRGPWKSERIKPRRLLPGQRLYDTLHFHRRG